MSYGKKQHSRTIDRIHLCCRLELANPLMSLGVIAHTLGMSQTSLSLLRKTKNYQAIKNIYLTGILTKLDDQVQDTYNLSRQYLEVGVPVAMQNLLNLAMSGKNEQIKLKASVELLNRHGRHPAVSRIGVTVDRNTSASTEEDNAIAGELIGAKTGAGVLGSVMRQQEPLASIEPINNLKQ